MNYQVFIFNGDVQYNSNREEIEELCRRYQKDHGVLPTLVQEHGLLRIENKKEEWKLQEE